MKNVFTAIILGIALASVSFAQSSFKPAQRGTAASKTRIAVVEFTPGPGAGPMDHEAKRGLQAYVASQLAKTHRFSVYDVRNTRHASQDNLAALNGGSTAAAVKLGKQLDVRYVLTGTVAEYDAKSGQVTLKFRYVDVATGKVKYSGQSTGQSSRPMRTGTNAEMLSNAVRPAVLDLTAQLSGV